VSYPLLGQEHSVITIKLLDFVHRPDFYKQKTQRFGNWICFRLQAGGGGTYSTEKNQKLAFPQAMPEQKKNIQNNNTKQATSQYYV
jgi:hypothetical protein